MEAFSLRHRLQSRYYSMRGRFRFSRRPNPLSDVLVLCGTWKLNPVTAQIVENFPKYNYIFAGFDGKNCHANFQRPVWWRKCFGDRPQFRGIIMEHCDLHIHPTLLPSLKDLVALGGFFLYIGSPQTQRASPLAPGFRLAKRYSRSYLLYTRV